MRVEGTYDPLVPQLSGSVSFTSNQLIQAQPQQWSLCSGQEPCGPPSGAPVLSHPSPSSAPSPIVPLTGFWTQSIFLDSKEPPHFSQKFSLSFLTHHGA